MKCEGCFTERISRAVPRRSLVSSLGTFFVVGLAVFAAAQAQTADRLSQVRKLYVGSLGHDRGAAEVRSRLVRRLRRSSMIQIVGSVREADAVAKGTGRIWTTGHASLDPHVRGLTQSTFEGFLSLEVIGKDNETLWSFLVTPSAFSWNDVPDDLASQLVKQLLADIRKQDRTQAPSASDTRAIGRASLKGAGATFPAPLYRSWFEAFEQSHPDVRISYDAVGSGEGIGRLKEKQVDFAASEMPLSDEELSTVPHRLMQLPVVLGAVVPIYHVENLRQDIHFTPETLAAIYLGKIKKWNDPQIKLANRGVTLPDADIVVIHRSDGSGTTFVWSDYLSKVSPEWKNSVGTGVTVSWPVGVGADYSEGVAAAVQHTANSIGYVEFIYAIQHELKFAAVKNAAGQFVRAGIASVKAASMSAGLPNSSFAISITDAPGKNAYPIATYTWLLLPEQSDTQAQRAALLELLQWMLSSGQKRCSALGYAALPGDIAQRALQSVSQK